MRADYNHVIGIGDDHAKSLQTPCHDCFYVKKEDD